MVASGTNLTRYCRRVPFFLNELIIPTASAGVAHRPVRLAIPTIRSDTVALIMRLWRVAPALTVVRSLPGQSVLTLVGVMSLAYKTAISRNKASAPVRALNEKGLLVGRMLDYGCGRGRDACEYGMESYDPHFQPVMPDGQFDTIVCNFVLNVIESSAERRAVVQDIQARLAPGGRAFISVRTDKARLNGYTKIGTWQGRITLDAPVVARGSGYVTYMLVWGS